MWFRLFTPSGYIAEDSFQDQSSSQIKNKVRDGKLHPTRGATITANTLKLDHRRWTKLAQNTLDQDQRRSTKNFFLSKTKLNTILAYQPKITKSKEGKITLNENCKSFWSLQMTLRTTMRESVTHP